MATGAIATSFATEPGGDSKPKRTHPWQSSHWERIEEGLGNIALDGTLKLIFPLAESRELNLLGVRCVLAHRIETDAYGNVRSAWRVLGLQSSLVPSGREHLLWQPLAGRPVRFVRSEIGRALRPAGATDWLIRMASPKDFEIRSLDGRVWRYAQGLLQRAEHPALGEIHFTVRGGFVQEISRAREAPLLRAEYDDAMRLTSLTLADGKPHRFRWSADGELLGWERVDGGEVAFAYRDGLLAEMRAPDADPRRFTWAENPGLRRGDSIGPAPVHLTSDGENQYAYKLTSRGLVIERRDIATGTRTVTMFNPRRHRLEQQAKDETLIVTFRSEAAGQGAPERIETGRGEILEDYRYNARGQLVGVTRKGEPEMGLSYDESGRLMALIEKEEP